MALASSGLAGDGSGRVADVLDGVASPLLFVADRNEDQTDGYTTGWACETLESYWGCVDAARDARDLST